MARVTIEATWSHHPGDDVLAGCHLDLPVAGAADDGYALTLGGWVVGLHHRAVSVELIHQGALLAVAPVGERRPDVAGALGAGEAAARSGWTMRVSVLGLPPAFALEVQARLEDGTPVPTGRVAGTRETLPPGDPDALQPLVVVSHGRSGSTWLLGLLAQHPELLAYRPFAYEPRLVGYWTEALRALAEPASYLRALATSLDDDRWWLGPEGEAPTPLPPDPAVRRALTVEHVEAVAAVARARVEAFHRAVAVTQGKPSARRFVEKSGRGWGMWEVVDELFADPRQVVLVRDPRDLACSVTAYNERHHRTSFGQRDAGFDGELLEVMGRAAAHLLAHHRRHADRSVLVRYEDLVLEPRATLTRLLGRLGLDATEATVDGVVARAATASGAAAGHATSPDPRRSVGRWRRDLTRGQQELCAELLGPLLAELGYERAAAASG